MDTQKILKILWFSNTPANADEFLNTKLKGSGGWIKALDQELQKKVDLCVVFYGRENKIFKHEKTNYFSIKDRNNLIERLKNRLFGNVIDREDLDKYISIINYVKPDLIHIHGTENPFGCILSHVNIPVVVSIQGNITVCLHKYFSGFEKSFLSTKVWDKTNVKSLLFPQSFRNSFRSFSKMRTREVNNLKNVRNVIGRTDWDRRITRILAPHSKYYHCDEILRPLFFENFWKPNHKKDVILFTTNGNTIYKGFETLCHCLYELNNLGFNFKWKVAGIKPSDLIVYISKKKLGTRFPSKGLFLLGNLSEEELIDELLESDIYIMPSHIENSPNNLSEAMIIGMPCISTFVGGVGSLVKDKENGILIQSGDPWSMAGAIIELINDKELAIRLGQNARKSAMERHNKSVVVDQLLEIYKSIISGNN